MTEVCIGTISQDTGVVDGDSMASPSEPGESAKEEYTVVILLISVWIDIESEAFFSYLFYMSSAIEIIFSMFTMPRKDVIQQPEIRLQ